MQGHFLQSYYTPEQVLVRDRTQVFYALRQRKDPPYMAKVRADRTPGNRGALEAAKQKILKTQDTCGICGQPVDMSLKYPHPLSPTVDHIIPVSKGGHPTDINNLQLAHRTCNRQKSDKIIDKPLQDDTQKQIGNRDLPLHSDWKAYRA